MQHGGQRIDRTEDPQGRRGRPVTNVALYLGVIAGYGVAAFAVAVTLAQRRLIVDPPFVTTGRPVFVS